MEGDNESRIVQAEERYFEGDWMELSSRYAYRPEYLPLLVDYLGVAPGMRVLEVGCGTGFLARLLARTLDGLQIIGLDADDHLLDLARPLIARDLVSLQVELCEGDAYHLPFSDETFDLVTSQTLL